MLKSWFYRSQRWQCFLCKRLAGYEGLHIHLMLMLYIMNNISEYSTHFRKMQINFFCAWSVWKSIKFLEKNKIYCFLILFIILLETIQAIGEDQKFYYWTMTWGMWKKPITEPINNYKYKLYPASQQINIIL